MDIKYVTGQSDGAPFEAGETRSIVVTAENLSASSGYQGDTITYTATVRDNIGYSLPGDFIADLEIDSTKVVTDQVFEAAVYDPGTGGLTLTWTVPADMGIFTVKLVWDEQLIAAPVEDLLARFEVGQGSVEILGKLQIGT